MEDVRAPEDERLAEVLRALANPARIRMLRAMEHPAKLAGLAAVTGMTRQGVQKHVEALVAAELVRQTDAGRAKAFQVDPPALFAFKEHVAALGGGTATDQVRPSWTVVASGPRGASRPRGPGLWMVHGDVRGRWIPLQAGELTLGRDPNADLSFPFDPFMSHRHAVLWHEKDGWQVRDLHSTNGSRVNFAPIESGSGVPLGHGDILGFGRVLLVLHCGG